VMLGAVGVFMMFPSFLDADIQRIDSRLSIIRYTISDAEMHSYEPKMIKRINRGTLRRLRQTQKQGIGGDELYWLYKDESLREIRVTEMRQRVTEVLYSSGTTWMDTFSYKVSPTGRYVMIGNLGSIIIYDRKHRSKMVETGDHLYPDLLGWSKNDTYGWFGDMLEHGWSKLGVFSKGRITWYDIVSSKFTIYDIENGWVTRSLGPWCLESDCVDEYRASGERNILELYDVKNDRLVEVDEAWGEDFEPRWEGRMLTYEKKDGGKRYSVNPRKLFHGMERSTRSNLPERPEKEEVSPL